MESRPVKVARIGGITCLRKKQAANLIEREASSKTKTETLRVDQVSESRHKFVSATPHVVTVEHDGEDIRLVLPSHCPACDFHVTSAVGDFQFLIGNQRAGRDGETYRGAVVVARRRKDGVYATELWHETHLSFVMRVATAF
jgi:hypothetical protein